jgi:hypothetical protein
MIEFQWMFGTASATVPPTSPRGERPYPTISLQVEYSFSEITALVTTEIKLRSSDLHWLWGILTLRPRRSPVSMAITKGGRATMQRSCLDLIV